MASSGRAVASFSLLCTVAALIGPALAGEKVAPELFEKLMKDVNELKKQDDGSKDVAQLKGFEAGLSAYETLKSMMKSSRMTKEQEQVYFSMKIGQRPNLVDKLDEKLAISTIIQLGVFDNNRSKWCECAPNCDPQKFVGFQRLLEAYKHLVSVKDPYLSREMSSKIDNSFRLYKECNGLEELQKYM